MRLTSVVLRHCRLHRELRVDFDPSRTLIGGPNETGKSTLIEAVHRALFLKAKGNTEQHRALISTLYPGHPEVELTFQAGGHSYVLKKRFGPAGTTTLAPSNAVPLSGDQAETELARILNSEPGLAGKALAAQWAHLWVWQGQSGDDPSEHATAQQDTLLQRLQTMGGAAALQSELDARLAQHFADMRGGIFTQAGKPKAGSDLERASSADRVAQESLELARERMRKLETAAAALEDATRLLASSSASLLELEKQQEDTAARGGRLAELRQQETEQTLAWKGIVSRRDALKSADQQVLTAREEIDVLELSLRPGDDEVRALEQASREACERLQAAESAYEGAMLTVRTARLRQELATAEVQRIQKFEAHGKLVGRNNKVTRRRSELAALETQLAALPKIDKAKLDRILKLESSRAHADAALQAMATGLHVVASDQTVIIAGQSLEAGGRQILTEDTEVLIGPTVRLRIQPGGGTSLADAREAETESRRDLQDVLDGLGLSTVAAAAEFHATREELAGRIKAAEAELEGMGAESLSQELLDAESELAAATASVERLAALVADAGVPADLPGAKALEKALTKALRDAEDDEAKAESSRAECATALVTAGEKLTEKRTETSQQRLKLHGMKAQLELLVKTHGDDPVRSQGLVDMHTEQAEAQALLKATGDAIAALQPELLEGDRQRIVRAVRAWTEEQSGARTRMAVAKAALNSDGSEDPAAELATAEARARSAGANREAVERHAEAVALLHEMFHGERRGLAEQFTRPLADKISGYLQCLFGAGARAHVDREENEFTGLRLFRPGFADAPFGFDTLSGGAREQTAAAVRLAMAELLAADFDGCLPVVFDDAFAYSDSERVGKLQRMLDLAATRGLQVIILTCSPVDYASLGATTVTLRPERLAPSAGIGTLPSSTQR